MDKRESLVLVAFAVAIVILVVQGLLLPPQEQTWLGRLEIWSTADLTDPRNQVAQFQALRRIQLDAERATLRDAYERGAFSSESIQTLRTAIDSEEISLDGVDGRAARG